VSGLPEIATRPSSNGKALALLANAAPMIAISAVTAKADLRRELDILTSPLVAGPERSGK
jgi:hypothetical protein